MTPPPGTIPFKLGTPPTRAQKPGPLHRVEFVIEVAGPKSIPAAAAAALLRPEWYEATGRPKLWVMAPGDTEWHHLTDNQQGSYDSLSMCWPYIGTNGSLNSRSVLQLVKTAEQFAVSVGRRALTLPPPGEIDGAVRSVKEVVQRLDIGFSVGVVFVAVPEQTLWQCASEMGFSLSGCGEFIWGATAELTFIPLEEPYQFTLGNLKAGRAHQGVTIGFSAPLVANPLASLQAAFQVGDALAGALRGLVLSDDNDPLGPDLRRKYEENLRLALNAFEQAGLVPGSSEAKLLFS